MRIKKEINKLDKLAYKIIYHKNINVSYKIGRKDKKIIKKYHQLYILRCKYLRSINYLKE